MLMVSPPRASTRVAVRKEPGMATPTNAEVRSPSTANTTIITSRMAASTLFCRSRRVLRTCSERSCVKATSMPAGQDLRSPSTVRRT